MHIDTDVQPQTRALLASTRVDDRGRSSIVTASTLATNQLELTTGVRTRF
ncbi:hypothetical protein [Paraburkholderia sp. BL27I4N3]|nr:hypothetical protein [Paraburkholderia sp. BL27I4N3]